MFIWIFEYINLLDGQSIGYHVTSRIHQRSIDVTFFEGNLLRTSGFSSQRVNILKALKCDDRSWWRMTQMHVGSILLIRWCGINYLNITLVDYDLSPEFICFDQLTHLPLDTMASFSQMTFSNAFSWMEIFVFQFRFHWSLFLRVQSATGQDKFR